MIVDIDNTRQGIDLMPLAMAIGTSLNGDNCCVAFLMALEETLGAEKVALLNRADVLGEWGYITPNSQDEPTWLPHFIKSPTLSETNFRGQFKGENSNTNYLCFKFKHSQTVLVVMLRYLCKDSFQERLFEIFERFEFSVHQYIKNEALSFVPLSEGLGYDNETEGAVMALMGDWPRSENTLYRTIFLENVLGMAMIDASFNFLSVNPALCQVLGYSKDELLKDNLCRICAMEHEEQKEQLTSKLVNKQVQKIRMEQPFFRKDGSMIIANLSISALYDITGEYTGGIVTIEDVSDKKKVETDILEAKKAAERARAAERQFLANMSHEIRTPMNAVIGMTHLLLNTNPTEEQKEYLTALKFSADTLIGIITNILDLSKIEASEIEFDQHQFSLRMLLQGLQQTFQFKVEDKPISVVVDIDDRIQNRLVGDYTRLNQIFTNLLGNACKFTNRGTMGVSAQLTEQDGEDYWIEFKVFDTGIGIAQEHLSKIFESFKQAGVDIHRKFGGTGLGLSIVKQLVNLQGGHIRVESELGKGTTFSIMLPFGDSGVLDDKTMISFEETPEEERNLFKGTRLLVVEDNPMNQKLISKILDAWACEYTIANNGQEALIVLEKQIFDLILMDVHMPQIDGCETTQLIRANTQNPNHDKPIVALTAAALLDEKNRVLAAGMDEFLTKPFSPKQLKNILMNYLCINTTVEEKVSERPLKKISMNMTALNLTYLEELSGNDNEFIVDILETFLDENPKDLEKIEQALGHQDFMALSKTAHKMKASFHMLGLHELQDNALRLEKTAKQSDPTWQECESLAKNILNQARASYLMVREAVSNRQ